MNEEVKRWHQDTLSCWNNEMYDSLVYEHHISSETMKQVEMMKLDGSEEKTFRGYFATRNKMKYIIGPTQFSKLPIKVKQHEDWKLREDVVFVPTKWAGFRIEPKHTIEFKALVDDFIPFNHTNPDHFTLLKIVALMADVGRTYVCVASTPEFMKSSTFQVLNAVNNRTPVFEPRTVPGILNKITTYGNMVFDDVQNIPSEPKKAMEQMNMQIAGGSAVYLNGAMKSHQTKNKYDTHLQSITYLYNDIENYKNPEKKYFDVMFENNGAIDTRFLKLKLTGKLEQDFKRNFDIVSTAKENRQYYIDFAKELAYLQQFKQSGKYEKKYEGHSLLELKGRKKLVYDELCWGIDMYCSDQEEYNKFVGLLDLAITDYRDMVNGYGLLSTVHKNIEEEVITE